MSLNKFTDPAVLDNESKKPWMNINCNAVNGTEMYKNGVPLNPSGIYGAKQPLTSLFANPLTNITGPINGSTIIPSSSVKEGSCFNIKLYVDYDRSSMTPELNLYVANSDFTQIYYQIVNETIGIADEIEIYFDIFINITKQAALGTSTITSYGLVTITNPITFVIGSSLFVPFSNTTTYDPSTDLDFNVWAQLGLFSPGTAMHVLSLSCTQLF